MAGSYEKINYSLRPAKCIERKMLCEVFRRLHEFASVDSYRYIGFGSTYFSDFILMHKSLGINNMISIEKDIDKKERFKFNLPFKCIEIQFGNSTEVLASLIWDLKSIVWLDYDGQLNLDMLADIKHIFGNIISGSIIIISCSAYLGAMGDRLNILKENIVDKVPMGIQENDLDGWKTAALYRNIINNEIEDVLNSRNGIRHAGAKFRYKQLFNFNYSDGVKMLTLGGIIYEQGESTKVEKCGFSDLSFIRSEEEPYKIKVPILTYKEIRYLDCQLPCDDIENLELPGAPKEQIKRYAQYYRYFPNFAETEI